MKVLQVMKRVTAVKRIKSVSMVINLCLYNELALVPALRAGLSQQINL